MYMRLLRSVGNYILVLNQLFKSILNLLKFVGSDKIDISTTLVQAQLETCFINTRRHD